jgi:ankyrin repeat protein
MRDRRCLDARRGPDGTTPLHEAVRADDADLVRALIHAGADLTARDARYGSTPLGWAKALGRPHLVSVLEAAALGVDPMM